LALIWQRPVG